MLPAGDNSSETTSSEGWRGYYRAAAQYATGSGGGTQSGVSGETDQNEGPRERGTRRKRLAGYLQAANELRQSYTQGYTNRSTDSTRSSDQDEDGWPQASAVSADGGELVLFPSYARFRPKDAETVEPKEQLEGAQEQVKFESTGASDLDAVVEVDVRGWLYVPHSGPMNRKSRYALWVARQLCGLPAEAMPPTGSAGGSQTPERDDVAQAIADISRPEDSDQQQEPRRPDSSSQSSITSGITSKIPYLRNSGNTSTESQPHMSPDEIKAAHEAFNSRMAPFTYRSIPNSPVTIFFYNNTTSQSRQILTSSTGHFSLRAELGFLPTHVRVLVTENLSATEEICLHPPDGISLISDIDDTIKHSAIGMSTREMFRNTFIAPLGNLVIPGVSEWYSKLAAQPYNVTVHYISNSPWQLFPLLKLFFQEAGLPPGSFHLKLYSGMLQGIFEPVAERKKGTVEKVISDFPHRKWLLVGDSGEADLEVYTEIAERWPEKIIAICIRDVTTSPKSADTGLTAGPVQDERGIPRRATTRSVLPPPTLQRKSRLSQELIDFSPDPSPPSRESEARQPFPSATPLRGNPLSPYGSNGGAPATASMPDLTANAQRPQRPEKPEKLRAPRVPPKPEALRQTLAAEASSPPSLQRASTDRVGTGTDWEDPLPPSLPRRSSTRSSMSDVVQAAMEDHLPVKPLQQKAATTGTVDPGPQIPQKELLWRRRWEVAQEKLDRVGVKLFSWREGKDVMDATVELIEREMGMKPKR